MEINLVRNPSTPLDNDKLIYDKCCSIPDITIFNSENRVKIFSECHNKHFNTYLLDEYIKKNILYNNIYVCKIKYI